MMADAEDGQESSEVTSLLRSLYNTLTDRLNID